MKATIRYTTAALANLRRESLSTVAPADDLYLSPATFCRLMRRHRVTIRDLAARTGITLQRIRQFRSIGVRGPAALDMQEAITGEFSPRLRACLRYWRREVKGG